MMVVFSGGKASAGAGEATPAAHDARARALEVIEKSGICPLLFHLLGATQRFGFLKRLTC